MCPDHPWLLEPNQSIFCVFRENAQKFAENYSYEHDVYSVFILLII